MSIKNTIETNLASAKQIFLESLDIHSFDDKDFIQNATKEVDKTFTFNKSIYQKALFDVDYYWQVEVSKITIFNFENTVDFLQRHGLISPADATRFYNAYTINQNKSVADLKNFINKEKELMIAGAYLKSFDLFRQEWLKNFTDKIKNMSKMQKHLHLIQGVFGSFWDLTEKDLEKIDIKKIERLNAILEKKDFIVRISELIGRLALSQSRYEKSLVSKNFFVKSKYNLSQNPENTTGVHHGNEIPLILPHQLAMRKHKLTNLLFKSQFLEKKLIVLDQNAPTFENQKKLVQEEKKQSEELGPFVLCLDTSGSMKGDPEMVAKAMAMAIAKIAIRQQRKCFVISFSANMVEFDASNLFNNFNQLYEFLTASFHGGTNLNMAAERAIEKICERDYRNADVIFVSDLIVDKVSDETALKIAKAKHKKVRFHALAIGNTRLKNNLSFFNNIWVYDGTQESVDKIINLLNRLTNKIS